MAIRMISVGDSSARFYAACEAAGIKTTRRQWKKWQNKKGQAYQAAQSLPKE